MERGCTRTPPQPSSPGEDEPVNVERDSAEEDAETSDQNQNKIQGQGPSQPCEAQMEALGPGESGSGAGGGDGADGGADGGVGGSSSSSSDIQDPFSSWSTEEREKLLLCAAKIFQIQFPLYTAYKHNTHPTIEDISAHESNILGSFCDMNDVEVPLHLLRYVCLFCGKHGLSLMKEYLCKLSDQELRQSAARNMADLMWSTVKEPLDSALCFDKESLDLAFKYFMSPTLTMRLAGLSQITNQLHTFNDVCNNESLVSDTETSIAKELADWLIHNNVVEHIFGPNLHIEVILNFLAAEGRLSTQHVDCIWAAAQLKHCSRYIHDLFPSLIKNLDPVPLRHVLNLVSGLHPSAHTEQTLYLASMLIKALWNNALAAKAQLSKQSSFASLLNTNLPMGNKKGSPAASPDSSDNSDTQHSGGSDMEMDDQMMSGSKRGQQRLSDTEGAGPSGSGGGAKSKNLPFNPETSSAAVMASASLEGRMRMLDACSASTSARPDVTEPQQPEIGPSQMDMLSADDVSCSSSQVSAKSEKNMADFDGEESGCEEELVQINSHAELSSHLQQHLPNLASIYHEHLVQGPAVHKHQFSSSHAVTDINLDNVCKKGNTLLWDLAEKLLCSLVCWFTDRQIRMRFIEGCLDNLAHHRSVVVSLRLLPKLFGTFQQFGSSYDTHWITMWAEKELHMMKLFFDNLQHYIQEVREHRHKYSHSAEVQVRLQFLTCVFSTLGSPDHFRLSLEQVDILWHCLVEDAECYDDALHWFLNQVRSKDQHAMGMETYKHLFLEKMPQLKPETISMTGLNLFQHLCNLARLATSALDNASSCEVHKLYFIFKTSTNLQIFFVFLYGKTELFTI
ncbi:hypothetical protein F7725_006054 [Dissostichus mawsoni]|uniref:UBP34/UBP24/USP9X/USP9Y-like ARM repeat region domain-containing protein n=1 Tax=Dissostichus mawsoni TaxID=36200 RepID=A0A7J5YVC6_DISMA|nr:hypothetical protein F7725_006054 [Dissostichus mawsoni]